MTNQREHFRLDYPPTERPTLTFDKWTLAVIDLSEKGLKFDCGPRFRPVVGQLIKGVVTFKDGKTCPIAGSVLRHITDKNHCVLSLTQGVPLPKMMEEQRVIIKRSKPS